MARVFVVNKGGHNYAAAERFGTLVFCTEGLLKRWDCNAMFRRAVDDLADSHPEDFIVLTSLTSLCSIYCAVFAHKHGRLNLLIYKDGGYVERVIMMDEVEETQ